MALANPPKSEFGRRIDFILRTFGYRREDLANILNCRQPHISNWVNGKHSADLSPERNRLLDLARYLSDPVEYSAKLFGDRVTVKTTSPLMQNAAGAEAFVTSLTDVSLTPEEWNQCSAAFFMDSKAPWAEVTGNFVTDMKVHGFSFLYSYYRSTMNDLSSGICRNFVTSAIKLADPIYDDSDLADDDGIQSALAVMAGTSSSSGQGDCWRSAMDLLRMMVSRSSSLQELKDFTSAYSVAMERANRDAYLNVKRANRLRRSIAGGNPN